MDGKKTERKEKQTLSSAQYEKLADWGERAALVGLTSLVLQQIIEGAPITAPSVLLGILTTALVYYASYRILKRM